MTVLLSIAIFTLAAVILTVGIIGCWCSERWLKLMGTPQFIPIDRQPDSLLNDAPPPASVFVPPFDHAVRVQDRAEREALVKSKKKVMND